ncbi:multiple epidermal growth factor-like domains protein 11 [Drosophila busckii]|uniref:multiple epidermal growth factor-like domains protein 11 n=1 Tax=Drosophila busckii TaxID=30019 RepID=UPI00083EB9AB|nr:multiple epidermal growth factor-like domains protein 11 [Drosophila busckii]
MCAKMSSRMYKGMRVSYAQRVCCNGYKREGERCVPICANDCGHGRCIKPNVCACDTGYVNLNSILANRCIPNCLGDCHNGQCINPGVCECATGYKLETKTGHCRPV